MDMNPETKKIFLQSLTSRKFITVLYALTWLFIILLVVILKPTPSEAIVNALLMAIAGMFTAFVGGNVWGDHFGKSNAPVEKTANKPANKPAEQIGETK
jgi:peptidoglycan/LPS O-acetylase OafA/YrhL